MQGAAMCIPLPFGEEAATGSWGSHCKGGSAWICWEPPSSLRASPLLLAALARYQSQGWGCGGCHPCSAAGTPAWHMAPLHGIWQLCSAAGTSARCWHLRMASAPPCPAPGRILLQPQYEGGRGREKGAVPFSSSPDPPAGPCLALSPAQARTSCLSLTSCHFCVRITSMAPRAVPCTGTSLCRLPSPLGTSQPPLGPGDLEVALLFGSAAVRRLNSAPVRGI